MIDYSKWPRKKLSVTSIKLDSQNPRLSGESSNRKITQPQIIEYLVDNEGAYELAKKIAIQGYLLNEEPIVCKESDKFVVLEGNRRVAACKILINPDLLPSQVKRKAIYDLLKTFDIKSILKLEVRIAPKRDLADVIIVNRHTEGASIEKWDKTKQDRFFYIRVKGGESIEELCLKFNLKKSEIREKLMRFNFYQELLNLELNEQDKKELQDETKFNITNVERFYTSKVGKEFLGVEFNQEGGLLYQLPRMEYQKRLKRITLDVIQNKLNSRTFGDEKKQLEYIKKISNSAEFDLSIKPNKKFQAEYIVEETKSDLPDETNVTIPSKIKTVASKDRLIPNSLKWLTGIERLDRIFGELRKTNLDTQFNSAALLFRSYLDMVSYQYLYKNHAIKEIIKSEQQKLDESNSKQHLSVRKFILELGIQEEKLSDKDLIKAIKQRGSVSAHWVPSLKHMLAYIAQSTTLLEDIKLRQALSSYVKGNDGFLDHNDFNLLAHNEYFIKDAKDLKKVWNQLFPVLNYINERLA